MLQAAAAAVKVNTS